MKISDPLGKVYSHTMFRRRSYDMHDENDATTTPTPDPNPTPPPPLPPHTNRGGYFDARNRSRSHDRVVEEEEEDRESVVSERSEDSLSTKSSRIVGGSSRRLGSRRNQRGISSVRDVPFTARPGLPIIPRGLAITQSFIWRTYFLPNIEWDLHFTYITNWSTYYSKN